MKIGLDLHGVADANPAFFAEMTRLFMAAGHEIHVITGPSVNEATLQEIAACGLSFTAVHSIVDFHKAKGTPYRIDERGHFWVDVDEWNKTKGAICAELGIDFHIDDSPHYGQYFTTPYMQVKIQK